MQILLKDMSYVHDDTTLEHFLPQQPILQSILYNKTLFRCYIESGVQETPYSESQDGLCALGTEAMLLGKSKARSTDISATRQ
jgi:hypothetical protein